MRKITLLFASLFLMMGSAWAQWDGYKLKSVSTTPATTLESGYYVIYNNGRGTFMNSEGALGEGKVTWPTTASAAGIDALNSAEDLTNTGAKNKKAYVFYVDVQEGNKVSLQTGYGDYIPALTGNTTFNYSTEKGVWNYNFMTEGESNFLFLWSDNKNGKGNNIGLDCNGWSANDHTYSTIGGWDRDDKFGTSGNQSWTLHNATMELADLVKVTYVYKVGDEVYSTSDPIEQDKNSAANAPKIDFLTIDSYTGTIADKDCEIVVNCSVDLPFEAADKVENITKWYLMKMHSNNPKYIEPVDIEKDGKTEHKIEWNDATVTEANKDAHLWAFVGSLKDGFIVVNNNGLAINNSIQMDEVANAEKFKLAATSETSENAKNGFCLKHSNGAYLNAQNPLSTWGSTDAGSTIMLEEYVSVEAINIVTVDWEYDWVELTEMGATVKLAAEFTPANATDKTITWTSSNTKLLTVDENGLIEVVGYTGNDPVGVNITATAANGVSATMEAFLMVVNNNEGEEEGAYEVKLNTTWEMLETVGQTLQLVATAYTQEKQTVEDPNNPGKFIEKIVDVPVEEGIEFYWESDVPEVYVYQNGLVQVLMAYEGQATITAMAPNGKYAQCTLSVYAAEAGAVVWVELYPENNQLEGVGATTTIEAVFDPADAEDKSLVWESGNPEVLTVDQNGNVEVIAPCAGEWITIYATASNGETYECSIKVTAYEAGAVQWVTLNEEWVVLNEAVIGQTVQLEATINEDADEEKSALVWTSDDEDIATVDQNGLVTIVGKGWVTIYATAESGAYAECTIQVKKIVETPTGINAVEADAKAVIYDLAGRRVEKMEKGIYIVNGKKVVIK